MTMNEPIKILSIDAWRHPEGWTWNNHFRVGTIDNDTLAKLDTPRKLLRYMREHGYLSSTSTGKVRIDQPGAYEGVFIEIQARGTGEPLFAISSIH